jgi:hypothetical protein
MGRKKIKMSRTGKGSKEGISVKAEIYLGRSGMTVDINKASPTTKHGTACVTDPFEPVGMIYE